MTNKLTSDALQADHEALLKNAEMLQHLITERRFSEEMIGKLTLGWVEHAGFQWFSFPVFDEHGECCFKKLKKPPMGPILQEKGMGTSAKPSLTPGGDFGVSAGTMG